MERVDETINEICDWIQRESKKTSAINCDGVTKIINALAELISARAEDNRF